MTDTESRGNNEVVEVEDKKMAEEPKVEEPKVEEPEAEEPKVEEPKGEPIPPTPEMDVSEDSIIDSEMMLSLHVEFASALRATPFRSPRGQQARDALLEELNASIREAAKTVILAKKKLRGE